MNDNECVEFLHWCLPRLRMRWAGFRKVRGQVCKRIGRRMAELEIPDTKGYVDYIGTHPEEWEILDSLCRVTVSRFHRDRGVFEKIRSRVIHEIVAVSSERGEGEIRAWSAGCASGEEAYTLSILWKLSAPPEAKTAKKLRIIATDTDPRLLERAGRGIYPSSSLKDLPHELIDEAFERTEAGYLLKPGFREGVHFIEQDIRKTMPEGSFHLVLCRNLVWTYFEESLQAEIAERIIGKMVPGGFLVTGIHESPPSAEPASVVVVYSPCIFRKKQADPDAT